MTKMTKRTAYEMIINAIAAGEVVLPEADAIKAILEKEIVNLNNKTSKAKAKATASQLGECELVLGVMPAGQFTVTEIAAMIPNTPYSTSKVTAILRKLVEAGKVVNTKAGKKSLYAVADADEIDD